MTKPITAVATMRPLRMERRARLLVVERSKRALDRDHCDRAPFESADPPNVIKDFWKSAYEAIRTGS
jgi:hypothetical protein